MKRIVLFLALLGLSADTFAHLSFCNIKVVADVVKFSEIGILELLYIII